MQTEATGYISSTFLSFLRWGKLKSLTSQLGPTRLSQTVAHLRIVVDPLVGKHSLHDCLTFLHKRKAM